MNKIIVCSECSAGLSNDDWTHLDYYNDEETNASVAAFLEMHGHLMHVEKFTDGYITCACCGAVEVDGEIYTDTPVVPTCTIKWIDSNGEPTPDDNPAVGWAVYNSWGTYPSGSDAKDTKRYLICAEHLADMPGRTSGGSRTTPDAYSRWTFEPFEEK